MRSNAILLVKNYSQYSCLYQNPKRFHEHLCSLHINTITFFHFTHQMGYNHTEWTELGSAVLLCKQTESNQTFVCLFVWV